MENEIWIEISGYEGLYQVSDLGNIKSFNSNNEKILKLHLNGRGYYTCSLYKNKVRFQAKIHQLVFYNFSNFKKNSSYQVVNHKNFIRTDNRIENLEISDLRKNGDQKHLKSSSEYVGVSFCKQTNKWRSQIRIKNKVKYLGIYKTEKEASEIYNKTLNSIKL